MSALDKLTEFHEALDVPVRERPTAVVPREERLLRIRLVLEEAGELEDAILDQDLEQILDGLCDLLYVTYGTALTFGLGGVLKEAFAEVHRSNMTKAGGPKRKDGKVMKPEGFSPPDLQSILQRAVSV